MTISFRQQLTVAVLFWVLICSGRLSGDEPLAAQPARGEKPRDRFVRVQRSEEGVPVAMETAVIRYVSSEGKQPGLIVELIGAVHIADKSYYDELNKLFQSYDALLYELVAPEEARVPKAGQGSRGGNPLTGMQTGLKSLLGLEFQLDCVDYTKKNFVHADMSPKEFAQSMADRGESFFQLFFRMMGQGLAEQSKDPTQSNAEILFALFSKDRALRLKRVMADQFENLEASTAALEGSDGTTLISQRNKKALEVLRRELNAGKKRLGIFYGAGHLPDMERRLLSDFGLKRDSERWLSAWSMQPPAPRPAE